MRRLASATFGGLLCLSATASANTDQPAPTAEQRYVELCGEGYETDVLLHSQVYTQAVMKIDAPVLMAQFSGIVQASLAKAPSQILIAELHVGEFRLFAAFFVDELGCSYHHAAVTLEQLKAFEIWQEGMQA